MNYLLDLSGIIDLEIFHEYVSKKLNFQLIMVRTLMLLGIVYQI